MRVLGTDHVISVPMTDLTKNCIQCSFNPQKVIHFPLQVKKKSKQIFIKLIMPPAGLPNKGLRK
jgi:hypothetical protein